MTTNSDQSAAFFWPAPTTAPAPTIVSTAQERLDQQLADPVFMGFIASLNPTEQEIARSNLGLLKVDGTPIVTAEDLQEKVTHVVNYLQARLQPKADAAEEKRPVGRPRAAVLPVKSNHAAEARAAWKAAIAERKAFMLEIDARIARLHAEYNDARGKQ